MGGEQCERPQSLAFVVAVGSLGERRVHLAVTNHADVDRLDTVSIEEVTGALHLCRERVVLVGSLRRTVSLVLVAHTRPPGESIKSAALW